MLIYISNLEFISFGRVKNNHGKYRGLSGQVIEEILQPNENKIILGNYNKFGSDDCVLVFTGDEIQYKSEKTNTGTSRQLMGSWENIYTKQLTINYRIGIRSSAYSTTAYIQLYKNGVLIKEFSSSDYNNIKYYTDTINVNIGENIEAYGWIEGGEGPNEYFLLEIMYSNKYYSGTIKKFLSGLNPFS